MNITVRIFPEGLGLINQEESDKIRAWGGDAFDDVEVCQKFQYQAGADYLVLVYADDDLVSFAAVIERKVRIDGQVCRMGGVGGVVTPPEHRGNGHASIAMKEVIRVILDTIKADVGGLFCLAETVGFYARLGWELSPAEVWVEQGEETVLWPEAFMTYGKGDGANTAKRIDVCGLPW